MKKSFRETEIEWVRKICEDMRDQLRCIILVAVQLAISSRRNLLTLPTFGMK